MTLCVDKASVVWIPGLSWTRTDLFLLENVAGGWGGVLEQQDGSAFK